MRVVLVSRVDALIESDSVIRGVRYPAGDDYYTYTRSRRPDRIDVRSGAISAPFFFPQFDALAARTTSFDHTVFLFSRRSNPILMAAVP